VKWQQGRERLDGMLARGELERVPASRAHADLLLSQAHQHLDSAEAIAGSDAAVLENQGLRATSRGGHIAVLDSVSAQLDPPLGPILRPFDRLRRRRNQAEYPAAEHPGFRSEDVARDLPKVREIHDAATKVLDQMSPY
jgi:hypothetical protein